MEEFVFNNNAKEQFKFFINESGEMALNIRDEKKELIACFILEDDELENLKTFLNNVL